MQKTARFILSLILTAVLKAPPCLASEETTEDYFKSIGSKFGRGISNILVSPGEIGCGIHDEVQEKKFVGVFSGFGKGLLFMLRRAFVGINETVTFVIPMDPILPPPCWSRA